MYVCICQGITDRQILDAIERGHGSSAALADALGAGVAGTVPRQADALASRLKPLTKKPRLPGLFS